MASSPRSRERVRPTQVQKRDPKGLYAKVAAGEIKSFTGMSADAPYEAPLHPEVDLPNRDLSVDECVQRLLDVLRREGVLEGGVTDPSGLPLPPGYVDGWLEDSLRHHDWALSELAMSVRTASPVLFLNLLKSYFDFFFGRGVET